MANVPSQDIRENDRILIGTDVRFCPVCGSGNRRTLGCVEDTLVAELNAARAEDRTRIAPWQNCMVSCLACGAGYLDPRPDTDSLQVLYSLWYRDAYPETQFAAQGDTARRAEFARFHLRHLHRAKHPPGRLLDVGTGTGLFLTVANAAGWYAEGLEWSAEAVELARDRHGLCVELGTLAEGALAGETYDAITMFDFLEHTETPAADLHEAARRLRPGGVLAIRVPNGKGWQARIRGLRWVGIISLHLTLFDRASLSRAVEREGLEIVFFSGGNYQSVGELLGNKLRWIRHRLRGTPGVQRSTEKMPHREAVGTRPQTAGRRIVAFALSSALELVDHAGGWFGAGNQIYLIARKPEERALEARA